MLYICKKIIIWKLCCGKLMVCLFLIKTKILFEFELNWFVFAD